MALTQSNAQEAKTGTMVSGSVLSALGSIPVIGVFFSLTGSGFKAASAAYNPERAAYRELMLRQGMSVEYANAYAKFQTWPQAKIEDHVRKLQAKRKRSPKQEEELRAATFHAATSSMGAQITTANNTVLAEIKAANERKRMTVVAVGVGTVVVLLSMAGLLFFRKRSRR